MSQDVMASRVESIAPLGKALTARIPARAAVLAAASLAVLVSRASFLPPTLEDIDSVNFALGLTAYDPLQHQPHPPGYPVYVAAAKLLHVVWGEPARALAVLSAVAEAALLAPLLIVLGCLASTRRRAHAAALLTLVNPILWFNGARPMSDSFGLLVATATQAALLRGLEAPRVLLVGAFLAGLAPGVRLQNVLLTAPLALYALIRSPGRRLAGAAAFAAGVLVWLVPLLVATGGFTSYVLAFAGTMGEAASSEPLLAGFTLNRAAKTVSHVFLWPWVSVPLGLTVLALAGAGTLGLWLRRSRALGLGLLIFGPYLAAHALVQQSQAVRYSLPYAPLEAWLAVEGVAFVFGRWAGRAAIPLARAAIACLALWCGALVLPALSIYGGMTSPPFSAFRAVHDVASPPERFVLAGHFMFSRYVGLRPPGLDLLQPEHGAALRKVTDYWRGGGDQTVLFVADPHRTDLESVAPRARRLLGRWEWPSGVSRFLSGARPNEVELLAIDRPPWFAGRGWLLSSEAGRIADLTRLPERSAYLSSLPEPTFLLLAGEPTGPAGAYELELDLPGTLARRYSCRVPLLEGYRLPAAASSPGYLTLTARTRKGLVPEGAPFVLTGLDYGRETEAGLVRGEGWFMPEPDERQHVFRWISGRAKALLHVPEAGARLAIEATVPLKYLGPDVRITASVDGTALLERRVREQSLRFDLDIDHGPLPFRELVLSVDRTFVPHRFQRNGDRRRLSLRVYELRFQAKVAAPGAAGEPGSTLARNLGGVRGGRDGADRDHGAGPAEDAPERGGHAGGPVAGHR